MDLQVWSYDAPLESPWEADLPDFPVPITSCSTQKLVLGPKISKNGCLLSVIVSYTIGRTTTLKTEVERILCNEHITASK